MDFRFVAVSQEMFANLHQQKILKILVTILNLDSVCDSQTMLNSRLKYRTYLLQHISETSSDNIRVV